MIEVIPEQLTSVETARLVELESGMQEDQAAFVRFGEALLEIRTCRLYRAVHGTFEDYCRTRWGFSRQRAHQYIEAAGVVSGLSTTVDIRPANESQARELGRLPPAERDEAWEEVIATAERGGITAEQVKLSVDRRVAVKVGRSGEHPTPALPAGAYSVILADPPWQYDFSNFSGKVAENHYPTMTTEAIGALRVQDVAASDCVLFLWATNPKLKDALQVIEAWGFDYKTNAAWEKTGLGLGYYFRQNHELLLVATRGNPRAPHPSTRVPSVIHAKKGRHSEKPGIVYDILLRMYPGARHLELFARKPRQWWTSWGNQIGEEAIAA